MYSATFVVARQMNARKPGPNDRELGRAVARRRKALKLTQVDMGELLGISHQQYGKNERGENSLTVARYDAILAIFESRSAKGGFSETRQTEYMAADKRALLQTLVDRLKGTVDQAQADLLLLQQELDRIHARR